MSTAAPVSLVFFFALCLPDGLLSAVPAAEASLVAECIRADVLEDLSLMLEEPDDLSDLLALLSLGIELDEAALSVEEELFTLAEPDEP